jgi:hypothetical protein
MCSIKQFIASFLISCCLLASALANSNLESELDALLLEDNEVPLPPPLPSFGPNESIPFPPSTPLKKPKPLPAPVTSASAAKSTNSTPKVYEDLDKRINQLLERLNFSAPPPRNAKRSLTQPTLINVSDTRDSSRSESFALPPDTSVQEFAPPPLANNRFSFYLGFTIPNDTTYSRNGNHNLTFQNGYQLGVDYNYRFEDDSYIGAFLEGKFFDTKSVAGFSSKGSNRLLNLGFTLGQDWDLSDQLVVKTEASMGGALTNYEIDAVHYSVKDFTFYYSFLLGLEFKWNESWQTSVYYELDGRASADRIDYQSFHQLGFETGFGF